MTDDLNAGLTLLLVFLVLVSLAISVTALAIAAETARKMRALRIAPWIVEPASHDPKGSHVS